MVTIPQFIHQLAADSPPPNCANPYAYERPFTAARRHNLQTYLELMVRQRPNLLLVAEAPGYRGCRLSGIPFVSPHKLGELGERFNRSTNPFQPADEWPHIQREASATIVWRTIGGWQPYPLLWNIFPFHPHQPGEPQSNRTPKVSEIAAGRPFLAHLLQIFPNVRLVAVGKKASLGLTRWGYEFTAVRHPAQGGAKQFAAAMQKLNEA